MVSLSDPKYADLQACCVCLGFKDDGVYKVDVDAAASLRSILRYLRAESSFCDIRQELGNLRIVTSDLLPMLKACKTDYTVFDLTVRLLVSLTQPAIVCFRNEIPVDRDVHSAYMRIDNLLKDCKKAFADEELFRVLAERVESLFNKTWDERSDEDRLLIERILVLIRNVLHIAPDAATEHRTDEDVSVHDQLLWAMHLSGWDDLLLFMANAEEERSVFAFHTLEIISLMFRQQTPEQLASAGKSVAFAGLINPESQILERCHLREKESKRTALIELNMRHNRFGGTFELLNTKSISDRPLIYHHDVTAVALRSKAGGGGGRESREGTTDKDSLSSNIGMVNLNLGKKMRRKPKNRKPLIERDIHRRSILSVQLYLQGFCWEFLRNCYNPLMAAAHGAIVRQSTQANDETYYLWAMRFFMSFLRLFKFRPEYISETLSVSTFNWVYSLCLGYREALQADRKGGSSNPKALQGSRRLGLAVAAFRQFLLCLQEMVKSGSTAPAEEVGSDENQEIETLEELEKRLKLQKQVAEHLMANIFYVAEYQDLYPLLLREYNESIQTKEYLIDLVEGVTLFINLLSSQEKSAKSMVISTQIRRRRFNEAQRKAREESRKHQKEAAAARKRARQLASETPEERKARFALIWAPTAARIIGALTSTPLDDGRDEDLPALFDPTAATDNEAMEKQLRNAIRLVHTQLQEGNVRHSVGIARRMWDIWPESAPESTEENHEEFEDEEVKEEKEKAVDAGMKPQQIAEFLSLRRIFWLDLEQEEQEEIEVQQREEEEEDENLIARELEDDDDEEGYSSVRKETKFNFDGFLLRFVHPKIIYTLTRLLSNYALNPASTNNCLIRLFHRIACKQRMPGAFFQVRLFSLFKVIATDRGVCQLDEFKELMKFIKYILRKFFEAFERNKTVVVEALFLKSAKENYEAFNGYGTFDPVSKTASWSPELDKELGQLFEAYRYDPVSKGEDIADVIKRMLSDAEKTRRQIIIRLMYLGKVASARNLKMMTHHSDEAQRKTRSKQTPWTDEENSQLRTLYDEHKGEPCLLSDIMDALRAEHDEKMKALEDYGQTEEHEGASNPQEEPILRNRKQVGNQLLNLGLVDNREAFGRYRGAKKIKPPRKRKAWEEEVEEISGRISVMKKKKWRKSRRKPDDASSPELVFTKGDDEERFSDEKVRLRSASSDESSNDDQNNKSPFRASSASQGGGSRYFDADDSSSDQTSTEDEIEEEDANPISEQLLDSAAAPAPPIKRRRTLLSRDMLDSDMDDEDEDNTRPELTQPFDGLLSDKDGEDLLESEINLAIQEAGSDDKITPAIITTTSSPAAKQPIEKFDDTVDLEDEGDDEEPQAPSFAIRRKRIIIESSDED